MKFLVGLLCVVVVVLGFYTYTIYNSMVTMSNAMITVQRILLNQSQPFPDTTIFEHGEGTWTSPDTSILLGSD